MTQGRFRRARVFTPPYCFGAGSRSERSLSTTQSWPKEILKAGIFLAIIALVFNYRFLSVTNVTGHADRCPTPDREGFRSLT